MSTKSSTATTNASAKTTSTNVSNNLKDQKQQQLKYIASVVRALVTSHKQPCTLRQILREYPEVESKPIQYKQYGYNSAEDLLRETDQFIFTRIGGETCISAKPNSKTAHIASMVQGQKASKSKKITQVRQQQRQPLRSDQSWNKSSYSFNVYQKLPPLANRFIESQNRANSKSYSSWGDRNNNNNQSNNRNNTAQQQQKTQQQQKELQRQASSGNSSKTAVAAVLSQQKDLREKLNVKNSTVGQQKDLRTVLNAKVEQQQLETKLKMQNGTKPDLRERLNATKQQQQQQQQIAQEKRMNPQPSQTSKRPILGQNNGAGAIVINQQIQMSLQQQQQQLQQQLLQNNAAIEIASSLILAQHQQRIQEQQRHQQRGQLLKQQQHQQQQQQQHLQQLQQQHQQQLQQQQLHQQQQNLRSLNVPNPAARTAAVNFSKNAAAAASIADAETTQMTSGLGGYSGGSSIQNRLKIRISNNNSNPNNNGYFNGSNSSAANTPDSSPAISSAGTEQTNNTFGDGNNYSQQPQFHKQKYMQKQKQQLDEPQPVIPPQVFQFNPRLDPITSLYQYCLVRSCAQPEYSVVKSKFSKLYQCRVKVSGSIFSTYPNEYANENMARIHAAMKAIEQIKIQESRRPLPPCTDTDAELIEKIYNEVLSHQHGMFAKNMTEWFETTYQQALPDHWWSLVQASNKFISESATNNAIIIFANQDADKDDDTLTQADMPTSTVIQMEAISLPWGKKYWDLLITHCASTVEVWARLFGKEYSEKFDDLMNDIDLSMLTDYARPLSIANKQIYLVCHSECWHRVRVEEMDKPNGTVLCFFIDFGDIEWLPASQLHICDPKFLKLPAQAVPFSLFGLEDFAGNPSARRHLDSLLQSKSVVAEILTKKDDFYAEDSSTGGKIQAVLYDTSSQDDVNLNPLLLNKICDDTPPPELKKVGVTNVLITHVTDDGELYLQISNSDLKYVQKLLHQLIESKFKRDQHKVTKDDMKSNNMFLICDESDSGTQPQWYRGKLTKMPHDPDVQEFDIFYVDNGQTRRTHISNIFRLESLSAALSKFPRQAIKAKLYNIPDITKGIVGRMRALMPPNCEALAKMSTSEKVPLITIYRRLNGSETLCTINDTIRIEQELELCPDDANDDGATLPTSATKSSAGLASPSAFVDMTRGLTITTSVPNSPLKSGELPKLKNYEAIPPEKDFFEVRVTMSANPSNFTIQPYKDYPRLRTLMKELQEYCENNDEFIPVDMVEIGQAYAAKNADGFYHRITVVNTYSGEMIHVCFCDFGDIAILRSDQLKILPAKFRQLPKMAIHAKLYGIAASDVDWTLEDCLRFRELTVGQNFVSTIKRISYDDKLSAPTLELELIDVTTDEDVYINEVLLKEKRAIKVNPDV